jgi:hypothetical protein
MANEGGSKDALSTVLTALGAFLIWCLRFFITRYFSRKDAAQKRREAAHLRKPAERESRDRKVGKGHAVGK